MIKIDVTVGFFDMVPSRHDLRLLAGHGATHAEVLHIYKEVESYKLTKVPTAVVSESTQRELSEAFLTIVMEVPDEWEKDLKDRLEQMLFNVFWESNTDLDGTGYTTREDATKPGWYLDDYDIYLS